MGDLANGHDCDAFVTAFASDIVEKFRSKLLDRTFGDKVRYSVMADDNWEVHLYAAIQTGEVDDDGEDEVAHFSVESAPLFSPTADNIVDQVLREFPDFSEDEVERRLKQGGADAERAWQDRMRAASWTASHG